MIAQLPEFYEDELIYSLLARYTVRAGLYQYRNAQTELYGRTTRPNFEYTNKLNSEVSERLGSMESIIQHHTMYGIYARFVPEKRRITAMKKLCAGETDYPNYLWHAQNRDKEKKYARYCPMCAKKERKLYGEAYWHRKHQIYGSNVCSKHQCYLADSKMRIHSQESPSLLPAELVIPQKGVETRCTNNTEMTISKFLDELIDLPFGQQTFSQVIKRELQKTEYISARGGRVFIQRLFGDIRGFYTDYDQSVLFDSSQLSKILEGKYNNPLAIAMIAVFLGLSPAELCRSDSAVIDITAQYDEQIKVLHQNGYNYKEISALVGGSYDYVKAIGNRRRGTKKQREWNPSSGMKRRNYEEMDQCYYPAVKEFVDRVDSLPSERPKRLSVTMVEKELGLTARTIIKMPHCYLYVHDHLESQEEYWIRKLKWSYALLCKENMEINLNNLVQKAGSKYRLVAMKKYVSADNSGMFSRYT